MSDQQPQSQEIPSIQLQADWEHSFKQKEEKSTKFWVNVHVPHHKTIYGEVDVIREGEDVRLKISHPETISISDYDRHGRWIQFTVQGKDTKFYAPVDTYTQIHTKEAVECIGLSPGGNIAITGSAYGKLRVWDAQHGTLRRDLVGHVGDIYCSKILPSGQVAMSGSADTQIKIWRLEDGLCAVTLRGHTAGVCSLSFIDRGRNFISSSRDGTVKLWDCASQSEITTLVKCGSAVTDCAVDVNTSLSPLDQESQDKKDFETQGKIALCVSLSGLMKVVDIRSRHALFSNVYQKGLLCCGLYQGYNAIAGSTDGDLIQYDLRNMTEPVHGVRRNHVAIESIAYHGDQKVWCATADGSCYLWDFGRGGVLYDLTGPDLSKLNDVAVHNKTVYTCSKDGAIRRYNVIYSVRNKRLKTA